MKLPQKFITYEAAEEQYGFSTNALNVMKSVKPELAHIFKGTKPACVDINYFIRRYEFKIAMCLKAQELVYFLEEYFSLTEIGKAIANLYGGNNLSIVRAMEKDIWLPVEFTTYTRGSEVIYKIYRYWWAIERRLRRRGTSISEILDNRMSKN